MAIQGPEFLRSLGPGNVFKGVTILSSAESSAQPPLSVSEQLRRRRVHRGHRGEPAVPLASSCPSPWRVPQGLGHRPARPQSLPRPQPRAEGRSATQTPGAARVRSGGGSAHGVGCAGRRAPGPALKTASGA